MTRILHPSQRVPSIQPMKDIYDGEPWTEMDIRDLTAALRSGDTIEDAAQHLCRERLTKSKAEELGLNNSSKP
jgi:hypothetical protein